MSTREHMLRNRLDWIDQIMSVCDGSLIYAVCVAWDEVNDQITR